MGALNVLECLFIITIVTVTAKPIDIRDIIINENDLLPLQETFEVANATRNFTRSLLRDTIGDLHTYTDFRVELTPNVAGGTFTGRLEVEVLAATTEARDSNVLFFVEDLEITDVKFTFGQGSHQMPVADSFINDDDFLEIEPGVNSNHFTFFIEYTGILQPAGTGLYAGSYGDQTYVGMNLHPIYARRVFPCMDEPALTSKFKFTFHGLDYTNIVSNSQLEDNSANTFRTLESPPHLWGMVAHNLVIINTPITNVPLYTRPGLAGQMSLPSVAIHAFFTSLNEWTNRSYVEIIADQNGNMNILALPDVSKQWNSLSTVGIWEPYVMMTEDCSIRQRSIAFPTIAESMARQWFGGVIYPRNWAHEWVLSGLATYAGWEAFKEWQSDGTSTDVTLLDAHTLFVTEIIQESLLLDAYSSASILEPANIFNEDDIRDHIHGILKYKSPALMRMFRIMLGDEDNDFIHLGARARLKTAAFQPIDSDDFIDSMNSYWLAAGGDDHEFIKDLMTPWIKNNGYPVLNVERRRGGVFVSQERFGFASQTPISYDIPITFTTSVNPNFEDTLYPSGVLGGTDTIDMDLDEEDWVLFNIQGQGYYRVNYDGDLWEILTEVLDDPDQREDIHPLNRGTLIDDVLNLARGRRLEYEVAFELVLTMQHETEYAPWKAFVRNMEFLRKRLVAMVTEDEDLDQDIYLRMVRRTIGAIEDELGFSPTISQTEPVMDSLTRGLVMEHACKANYQPCIAAAVDMFYDADDNVNTAIPHDIRPAVYCTMVKEAGQEAIDALMERYELETNQYERVVILQSLACSTDGDYVEGLLEETIANNSPYLAEERVKIFIAVAESSYENAGIALDFISRRTNEVRNMYGGAEKLEEVIFVLADNMANADLSTDFRIWVTSQNNNLDGSQDAANRALLQVTTNLEWDRLLLQPVYDWIDENDAPTFMLSFAALLLSLMVTLFNH
ncbi:unnamed protein product [Chrysodeixis includens]|uniref:Aminopeptidase n=1 Tax=Chrysodeixis includens TaxID=689277 RepID=A0A9P0C225_CHRIL|nr:unnamed protein product [Chrysodeixis includens]